MTNVKTANFFLPTEKTWRRTFVVFGPRLNTLTRGIVGNHICILYTISHMVLFLFVVGDVSFCISLHFMYMKEQSKKKHVWYIFTHTLAYTYTRSALSFMHVSVCFVLSQSYYMMRKFPYELAEKNMSQIDNVNLRVYSAFSGYTNVYIYFVASYSYIVEFVYSSV